MPGIRIMLSVGVLVGLTACADPIELKPQQPGQVSRTARTPKAAAHTSRTPTVTLSPLAQRVSQIASRNGDQNFLMIDKTHGRIIAFENGRPTFSGPALTGESPADRLQPDAVKKTNAEQVGLKYKVTPAGRFTVSAHYDNAFGGVLDVNEIKGKDWDIAIHKVWLGAPAEHRAARLRSPNDRDKQITYGCIDVDGSTMQRIMQRLPHAHATPLYILPVDETLVPTLFNTHDTTDEVAAANSNG
jgi:hypothetical protein